MTDTTVIFLVLAFVCVGGAWGLWKSFAAFNSSDGERFRKMRMQGPFIPLSAEDVKADALQRDRRAK